MAAWLIQEKGIWKIGFRWDGKLHKRSLKTRNEVRALALKDRANANLFDVEQGRLEIPPGTDLLTFLLTDGKKTERKPSSAKPLTLKGLFDAYQAALPKGAKSDNTLQTEKVHQKHLLGAFGDEFPAHLTLAELQRYVNDRSKAIGRRGRPIEALTIKKELATLSTIWTWAKQMGTVNSALPTKGLIFPKSKDKEPFQTRKQIEKRITRGGMTKAEEADLWASLYLELPEIEEVLAHVQEHGREAWVYPMVVFVAHTGARRSEALRSRIEDFDTESRMIRVREKKREKGKITFRAVPMSPALAKAMQKWFSDHPGGQRAFCQTPDQRVDENMSNHHFHWALAGSDWHGKIAGWHTFRHSFASNCARKRVDQRMIDRWLGHTTLAMRRRYQHLFPDDQRDQLALVFG